ncbi:MAG: hypothetical protein JNK55_16630 [Rubrivivax sp.]|nr:hypothetical protein [Rubrivivax sp.]
MKAAASYLEAGQPVPAPIAPNLGWRLASGLICHGPAFAGAEPAPPVHALARPGDLILPAGPDESARALMPCELMPLAEPRSRGDWHSLLVRTNSQQRRQAADLTALRTGAAADRVRHLLLMLAAPDAPPQMLPSLRAMSALLDIAPETVSRVVSAQRHLRLLDGGPPDLARRACQSARQLAVRPLPAGLSSSRTLRRPEPLRVPVPAS